MNTSLRAAHAYCQTTSESLNPVGASKTGYFYACVFPAIPRYWRLHEQSGYRFKESPQESNRELVLRIDNAQSAV